MAINFQAAAFLAGLKVPSQIMYCISQDTGVPAPVVVYKEAQNMAQSTPLWSNGGHNEIYNGSIHHKNVQNVPSTTTPASTSSTHHSNVPQTIQLPQPIPISTQPNVIYPPPPTATNVQPPPPSAQQPYHHHPTASQIIQTQSYIQVPSASVYTNPISNHLQPNEKGKSGDARNAENLSGTESNNNEKQFSCGACKKGFRLKSTLMQHERIHLDSRPYVCNFDSTCQKSFRQKSHLIQHSRIHFDCKPFSCNFDGCGKMFRQKAILSQHERIHCESSSRLLYKNVGGENATLWPFDVPYPNELEPKEDTKNDDNRNTSSSEKDLFAFSHSVFGSLTDSDFNKQPQHQKDSNEKSEISDKQGTMPQFVRCPICQVSYKQKSTLLQHGCVHIESRPYPCLFLKCGKRFRQQSHLVQHIRIHKNEKPYQCPYPECQGRCFRQRTILNQHIRIHTNSKPYRCSICGKDFRQQAILSQHEKTHQSHRPFACPLSNCKRRFVNETDLKKHIDNHMNPTKTKKPTIVTSSSSEILAKPEMTFYPVTSYPNSAPFQHHTPVIHHHNN